MLSKEEVKHILELSALEATDEELDVLQKRLSQMEEFVAQIKNAEIDDETTEDGAISMNDLREDDPGESYSAEAMLLNAPQQKFNSFAVPLMMEDD